MFITNFKNNFKNNTLTITKDYTPFKITKQKIRYYLDLHYPKLEVTDLIIKRCGYIFITLIKYADGYELNDAIVIWKEYSSWRLNYYHNKIFDLCFYSKNFNVLCENPNVKDSDLNEYKLINLLTDDYCYNQFKSFWSKMYNYEDLYDEIKVISLLLKQPLPKELIETILFCAYSIYNNHKIID